MHTRNVFLLGSGALAKEIVSTISYTVNFPLNIYIYSRSGTNSAWIATIGNICAFEKNKQLTFTSKQMDWESDSFLEEELAIYRPALVINTASLQSIWTLQNHNAWSSLVKSVGYGISLPLQCYLALRVGRAINRQLQEKPLYINCCYPDVVNYVLQRCNINVLAGIGNIGIIDLFLKHQTKVSDNTLMLANHFHVQQLFLPPDERIELPRIWNESGEMANTGAIFRDIILQNSPSLNQVTALTCLKLLDTVLLEKDGTLHLPGPLGYPGGYPVWFKKGQIYFIGTARIGQKEEFNWNCQLLAQEGLILKYDEVAFSEKAKEKIKVHSVELAQGFSISEIDDYINAFLALKESLSKIS